MGVSSSYIGGFFSLRGDVAILRNWNLGVVVRFREEMVDLVRTSISGVSVNGKGSIEPVFGLVGAHMDGIGGVVVVIWVERV